MNKLEEYKSKINYDVWEDLMWTSIVDEQKKIVREDLKTTNSDTKKKKCREVYR